ncbi:MAG: hypothetical protein HYW95_02490 [Candidatus Wildermuthbacteria bacterium]|nr:hypothetical protein [Candidatus Wildermuthbacteria bacterium]
MQQDPISPKPQTQEKAEEPIKEEQAPQPRVMGRQDKNVPETQEFLKREDVRTMAKDITQLREGEAQEERERIAQMKVQEQPIEKQPEPEPEPEPKPEPQPQPVTPESKTETRFPRKELPSSLPQPPSRFEKIFVRIVISVLGIAILVNGAFALYWYFGKQGKLPLIGKKPAPSPTEIPTPTASPSESPFESPLPTSTPSTTPTATATPTPTTTATATQTPSPSPSATATPSPSATATYTPTPAPIPGAIVFNRTATLLVSSPEGIRPALDQLLREDSPNGFTRVLLKDETTNQQISIQEFFVRGMGGSTEIQGLLGQDATIFVHTLPLQGATRKRIGIIAEVADAGRAKTVLKEEERTFEQETESFIALMGPKGSGYRNYFREYEYRGTLVRFQTLSKNDLGICYAFMGNKVMVTTSLESMERAIDDLLGSASSI